MGLNHQAVSEIVAGLVMARKLSASSVVSTDLEVPYSNIIKLVAAGKDDTDVISEVGFSAYNAATAAAEQVRDGQDVIKYVKLLEQVSGRMAAAKVMEKELKKLRNGDPCDTAKLMSVFDKMETGVREFVGLDTIRPTKNVWRKTYWDPWDEYFGGVPYFGMTLIGAPPGTGKTSAVIKLIDSITAYGKKVGVLTLELPNEIFLMRWQQINPELTMEQRKLCLTSDEVYTVDEAVAAMFKLYGEHPDIYAFFIDFADLMVPDEGEENTATASRIYRMITTAAKKMKKPVFLLCQLNSNYIGGPPQVNHIRWSRLAEALAVMIILIYNPNQLLVDMGEGKKNNWLPQAEGKAYLLQGKSRFGYKMGGLGAIQLDWLGARAWGDEGEWFSK